jgi:hypothetical protein
MKRLKLLSLIALLCIATQLTWGQTIAAWTFSNVTPDWGPSPAPPTVTGSGVTVVGLTRGSGITIANTAASAAWGGNGFHDGVLQTSQTANGAITLGNYFTFTITPTAGNTLSLSGIGAYNVRRSSSGPTQFKWQYSLDGTSFTDIGGDITTGTNVAQAGNTQPAITLSGISALQNVPSGTTVTFRIVMWNCSGQTGNFYFNSASTDPTLTISGTINSTALPLTLVSFKGQSENNTNVLNWVTANEENVASFELERGTDGRTFNKIATIKATGNSNTSNNQYTYNDNAASATAYYRLRMVDINDAARYSNIVILNQEVENPAIQVYPNPAESTLFVEGLKAKSSYRVIDATGREVIASAAVIEDNQVTFINTGSLVQGLYFLQLTDANGTTQTIRFVKK